MKKRIIFFFGDSSKRKQQKLWGGGSNNQNIKEDIVSMCMCVCAFFNGYGKICSLFLGDCNYSELIIFTI